MSGTTAATRHGGGRGSGTPARRGAAIALAATLVAAAAWAGAGSGVSAAADPPDPKVGVSVDLRSDGTGHGTSAQTFLTTANGYRVGDDAPDDGVVASGDTVTYTIDLDFTAGSARSVDVALSRPDYLQWPIGTDTFCRDYGPVKAARTGDTCTFTIPEGAVYSFSRTLTLRAADTYGTIQTDQVLGVSVALDGQAMFTRADADPVSVVSAPAVDAEWAGSVTAYRDDPTTGSGAPTTVSIAPRALTYPGASSGKGVSTGGVWYGAVDVSAFPDGTTWSVDGSPSDTYEYDGKTWVDVVGQGIATTPAEQTELTFTLPDTDGDGAGDWPAVPDGASYLDLDLSLYVFEESWSGGDLLNNGAGYDPGTDVDGTIGRDVSTADATTGARAGRVYANNNWTRVRILDVSHPRGVFTKTIWRPWSGGTAFDEGSKTFADDGSNAAEVPVTGPDRYLRHVDTDTELVDRLSAATGNLGGDDYTGVSLVLADLIDSSAVLGAQHERQYQHYDPSRPIVVTGPDGEKIPATGYTVQWTDSDQIDTDRLDDETDPIWRVGTPEATATAVRVILDPDTWSGRTGEAGGLFSADIPTRVVSVDQAGEPDDDAQGHFVAETNDADPIADRIVGDLWRTDGDGADPDLTCTGDDQTEVTPAGTCYLEREVLALAPAAPTTGVDLGVVTDGYPASDPYWGDAGQDLPSFGVTDTVDYLAKPKAGGLMFVDEDADPVVEITLDRCQTAPVDTSEAWDMEVIDAVVGSDGLVCGSADSTPAKLVFTPADGADVVDRSGVDDNTVQGFIDYAAITFSARISGLTPTAGGQTAPATAGLTTEADVAISTETGQAADDDSIGIGVAWTDATFGDVAADEDQTELGEDIGFTLDLLGQTATGEGTGTDRVVVLPRAGDASLADGLDLTGYDGHAASDFSGTYTLAEATLNPDETTPGTRLYWTTKADPGIDPAGYDPAEWTEATGQTPVPADATALRVVTPDAADRSSSAQLHLVLHPQGNAEGDAYVVWMSRDAADASAAQPWPDDSEIVASEVAGHVWWDDDEDGVIDDAEPLIPDVTVEIFRADDNGSPTGTALASATTDADGAYLFTGLHSGDYVVKMYRGDQIPDQVTSFYSQALDVDQTYGWKGRYRAAAAEQSSVIALAPDARADAAPDPDDVDFGFVNPNPKVALDKSQATTTDNGDGTVDVSWQVTVTNTGNRPVSDATLTDATGQQVYDVVAELGLRVDQTAGEWVVMSDGSLWVSSYWGSARQVARTTEDTAVPNMLGVALPDDGTGWIIADGRLWWLDDTYGRVYAGPTQTDDATPLPDLTGAEIQQYQNGGDGGWTGCSGGWENRGAWIIPPDGSLWSVVGTPGYCYEKIGHITAAGDGTPLPDMTGARLPAGFYGETFIPSDGSVWYFSDRDYTRIGRASAADGTPMPSPAGELGSGGTMRWGYTVASDGTVWGVGGDGTSFPITQSADGTPVPDATGAAFRASQLPYGLIAFPSDGSLWWVDDYGSTDRTRIAFPITRGTDGTPLPDATGAVLPASTGDGGNAWVGFADGSLWWIDLAAGRPSTIANAIPVTAGTDATPIPDIAGARLPAGDNGGWVSFSDGSLWWLSATGTATPFTAGTDATPVPDATGAVLPSGASGWATFSDGSLWWLNSTGTGYPVVESDNYATPVPDTTGAVLPAGATGWASFSDGSVWWLGSAGTIYSVVARTPGGTDAPDLPDTAGAQLPAEYGGWARFSDGSLWWLQSGSQASPASGTIASDPIRLPAASTSGRDGLTVRTYRLPYLAPGASAAVTLTGTVNKPGASGDPANPTAPLVIANQAWVDSPDTPIAGLLPDGATVPDAPVVPAPDGVNPAGIPGNPTCDTDADDPAQASAPDAAPDRPGAEDSCDQVPALIEASEEILGSLSGRAWHDTDSDGVRDDGEPPAAGVVVTLTRGGNQVGQAVTGTDGSYRFTDLAPGEDYQVSMDASDVTPATAANSLGWTVRDTGGNDATDSDVDRSGTTSPDWVVLAGAETTDVDGGLIETATAISVVKGETKEPDTDTAGTDETPQAEPILLADGTFPDTTVTVEATNTGDEPLTGLVFDDLTLAGAPATGWTWICGDASGDVGEDGTIEGLTLDPGATITLTATLPGDDLTPGQRHEDMATLSGTGTLTGVTVSDDDPWAGLPAEPDPALAVTKGATGDPATDAGDDEITITRSGEAFAAQTVHVTITNTGDETLTGLRVADATSAGDQIAPDSWTFSYGGSDGLSGADLEGIELAPGETITGTGTLTPTGFDPHKDFFTASGVGAISGTPVSADDPFTVTPVRAGLALPASGGSGTWPFLAAGLALVAFAAARARHHRRRA